MIRNAKVISVRVVEANGAVEMDERAAALSLTLLARWAARRARRLAGPGLVPAALVTDEDTGGYRPLEREN